MTQHEYHDDLKIMLGEMRGDLRGMADKLDTLIEHQQHYETNSDRQREHLRKRVEAVEVGLAGLRHEIDNITVDVTGIRPFVKSHNDAISFRRGALWVLGGIITVVTAMMTMIVTYAKPALAALSKYLQGLG